MRGEASILSILKGSWQGQRFSCLVTGSGLITRRSTGVFAHSPPLPPDPHGAKRCKAPGPENLHCAGHLAPISPTFFYHGILEFLPNVQCAVAVSYTHLTLPTILLV
eukprot:4345471-Amphidinium_carterae.1